MRAGSPVDDEEEDFFSMLEKEDHRDPPSRNVESKSSVGLEHSYPINVSPELVHHSLASDSDSNVSTPHLRGSTVSDTVFRETLLEFYTKYNLSNIEKVEYLADKFFSRRWELWEQLNIKYRLSPGEARLLWIKFNIPHDGIGECARKLFRCEEVISIPDDVLSSRRAAWRKLMGISGDESLQHTYLNYVMELAPCQNLAAFSTDHSDIVRDVQRTHQDLAFFQEVCWSCKWRNLSIRIRQSGR
jgi:hypothetical protein